MPEIMSNLWKTSVSYFWVREYLDGRIETEFDLDTGQIRPWGPKTPEGLKRAGWLPVTQDLAKKMKDFGEFGIPTQSPSILVSLNPGDKLIIYKDCAVIQGFRGICKACGGAFRMFEESGSCPNCGARKSWRCPDCNKINDTIVCPDCKKTGKEINPLELAPDTWEEVMYVLGIEGVFCQRFNSQGMITTGERRGRS